MFKKALSLLLALMLIVTSVSITALSVSAAEDDPTTEPVVYPVTVAGSNADLFGTAWTAGLEEKSRMTAHTLRCMRLLKPLTISLLK